MRFRRALQFTSAITLAAIGAISSAVAEPVSIAAIEIPGLYTAAGDGDYDKAYQTASKRAGLSATKSTLPPARAIRQFETQGVDCLAPADADFYTMDFPTVQTRPFALAQIFIFTAEGKPVLNSLEQLKGKQVGIRTGMPYGNAYDAAGLQSQATNSIANNIRKVMRGRVDAFLGYAPDVWDAFDELNMPPLPHDAANPVAVHRDSILCRDTVATRAFVGKLDAALEQMEQAGEL